MEKNTSCRKGENLTILIVTNPMREEKTEHELGPKHKKNLSISYSINPSMNYSVDRLFDY